MDYMQQQQMGSMQQADGGQLDPRLVQAIIALQQQRSQQDGLARQRALADALRTDNSQLQGSQNGRMYSAPTWVNMLAHVAQQYRSKKLSDDADTREQNMNAQRQSAMEDYFRAMTNQRRQPMPYMGEEGE